MSLFLPGESPQQHDGVANHKEPITAWCLGLAEVHVPLHPQNPWKVPKSWILGRMVTSSPFKFSIYGIVDVYQEHKSRVSSSAHATQDEHVRKLKRHLLRSWFPERLPELDEPDESHWQFQNLSWSCSCFTGWVSATTYILFFLKSKWWTINCKKKGYGGANWRWGGPWFTPYCRGWGDPKWV